MELVNGAVGVERRSNKFLSNDDFSKLCHCADVIWLCIFSASIHTPMLSTRRFMSPRQHSSHFLALHIQKKDV